MTINDGSGAIDPWALLLETDWSSVEHCCPNVAPATPVILAGLLDDDEDVQRTAVHNLGQAVTHQNSIYGATAPAARFVIAILGHPRTMTLGVYFHEERRRPMRAALLQWLGDLADDATYDEDGPGEPDDVAAVRAILPLIYEAARPYLVDADLLIREAAVHAAAMTFVAPELAIEHGQDSLRRSVRGRARVPMLAGVARLGDDGERAHAPGSALQPLQRSHEP
ncbi:hypothetical protein AB0I54_24215 [Streptomyces sp. NPDC050625]|uniref:hypothetical protein n=1 Tax=Streptomyces sp. NPDC050625 TaxID=3154629 RepID=UPI00342ED224